MSSFSPAKVLLLTSKIYLSKRLTNKDSLSKPVFVCQSTPPPPSPNHSLTFGNNFDGRIFNLNSSCLEFFSKPRKILDNECRLYFEPLGQISPNNYIMLRLLFCLECWRPFFIKTLGKGITGNEQSLLS